MAIRCYDCLPSTGGDLCTKPKRTINCDDKPEAVPGTFDTCFIASYESYNEDMDFELPKMFAMGCTVKATCQWYEEFICNSTKKNLEVAEIILKKCELKCCEVDECNRPEDKESRSTVSMETASVFITFIGVVMFMLEFFNY